MGQNTAYRPPVPGRFAGRTVLITGCGSGMGSAIALRAASEGASLVLTDISQGRLDIAVGQVLEKFPQTPVLAHRASVLAGPEVQGLLQAVGDMPVDALVNVVGGLPGRSLSTSFLDVTEEEWRATFELNHMGMFHLVRALAPGMQQRGYGRIVNVASIAFGGDPKRPHYAAAKAGVVSLTRSLAEAFAPQVTVNCIVPGFIATRVMGYASAQFVQEFVDLSLLKRVGQPQDIAAAAAYFASDDAAFVTGAILPVSGGIWPAL